MQLNKYQDAINAYDKAISINDKHSDAYFNKGRGFDRM